MGGIINGKGERVDIESMPLVVPLAWAAAVVVVAGVAYGFGSGVLSFSHSKPVHSAETGPPPVPRPSPLQNTCVEDIRVAGAPHGAAAADYAQKITRTVGDWLGPHNHNIASDLRWFTLAPICPGSEQMVAYGLSDMLSGPHELERFGAAAQAIMAASGVRPSAERTNPVQAGIEYENTAGSGTRAWRVPLPLPPTAIAGLVVTNRPQSQ